MIVKVDLGLSKGGCLRFDSNDQPILVILGEDEKEELMDFEDEENAFFCYSEDMEDEEAMEIMNSLMEGEEREDSDEDIS